MHLRYKLNCYLQEEFNAGIGTSYISAPNPIHWNLLQIIPHKYWSILKLFLNPDFELVSYLISLCNGYYMDEIAHSLLHITELCGTSLALLRYFINYETFINTNSSHNLFRSNSIASKMIRIFANQNQQVYLQQIFEKPIRNCIALSNEHVYFYNTKHEVRQQLIHLHSARRSRRLSFTSSQLQNGGRRAAEEQQQQEIFIITEEDIYKQMEENMKQLTNMVNIFIQHIIST